MTALRAGVSTVNCPGCGRKIADVTPCVKSLTDGKFRCRCGAAGTLMWKRGKNAVVVGARKKEKKC